VILVVLALTLRMSSALLPLDTLVLADSVKVVGVAIPAGALYVPGDLNFDGRASTSDIMLLIGNVLGGRSLPTNGDTVGIQVGKVTVYADTTKHPDTSWFTFIPTKGIKR
jgi:hypothetical protein